VDQNIEKIYKSLQKLLGLHRKLLDNVRLEREVLTQADLKGITDCSLAKQMLIEGIRQAEVERVRQTGELASAWRKPVRDLTLPSLILAVQGQGPEGAKSAELLRTTFNALTVLIKHISEQNQDNQQLVAKSLEHIQAMKSNVLGQSSPKSSTYNPHGQKNMNAHGARLISKEA
jgi:flagellar biosynthesis/type III secretory pathway chaperone